MEWLKSDMYNTLLTDKVFVRAHIHRVPVKGVLGGIHGEAFVMFGTQCNIPSCKECILVYIA